jgi:hypothetical protein
MDIAVFVNKITMTISRYLSENAAHKRGIPLKAPKGKQV